MKIIVPALGSRGDVQPYIALCQGLRRAGHDAVLATNPTLVPVVESYHVKVASVGPPVDMGAEGARIWEKSGRNWYVGFMRIMQLGMRLIEQSYPDIYALCQGADLVVATDVLAGAAEADKLGLPWFSATLQPDRIPAPDRKPTPVQRVVMPLINRLVMMPTNRFRRRVGAPPAHGGLSGMMSDRLVLLPVSRHVAPPNPRWPAQVRVSGYWYAQAPETWSPPEDLLAFMEQGDAPVVVSLGAMSLSGASAAEAARITLEALKQVGARAVIQGWDEPLRGMALPETVYHAGSMPHTWIFPRASVIVHHGGFGTTASALGAGIPAVVVPHIIDQHAWAKRVHDLGVGPKPVARFDLTVERLAQAIDQARTDSAMRERAAKLGELIRSEPDGVETAVRTIEQACGG